MSNNLHFYTQYSKEKIKISEKHFASGGEGALYSIASPRTLKHLVAKMYYPEKRTAEREAKMNYLVQNPPLLKSNQEHPEVAWVLDLLYLEHQFVGILMIKIKGKKLTKLCLAKLPKKASKEWQRFAFGGTEALKLRLKTCFNIATVLHQIHCTDKYVLVDLKPDNILMQPNGLIAFVDMDSVEVIAFDEVLFPAPVATPEYTPPEHYTQTKKLIKESWDRFSMGVIFYQLLFGLHPFAASSKAPHDNLVGLDDKIKHGLYVHHSERQHLFRVIPPPHQRFQHLPPALKELFELCFEIGEQDSEQRPTAAEWCLVLANILDLNINIFDILGPSSLGLNPTTVKSPAMLVDLKALEWPLIDFTIDKQLGALNSPGIMTPVNEDHIKKIERKIIERTYESLLVGTKIEKNKLYQQKLVQQREQRIQFEIEDFKFNGAVTGLILLSLCLFSLTAYNYYFSVLFLPVIWAFFNINQKHSATLKKRAHTTIQANFDSIKMPAITSDDIALKIHKETIEDVEKRYNALLIEIKKTTLLTERIHAQIQLNEQEIPLEDSAFEKHLNTFKQQQASYDKVYSQFYKTLVDFQKETKLLQRSEFPRIIKKLDQVAQSPLFGHYNKREYLELKDYLNHLHKKEVNADFALLLEHTERIAQEEQALLQKELQVIYNNIEMAYLPVLEHREALALTHQATLKIIQDYELKVEQLDELHQEYRQLCQDIQTKQTQIYSLEMLLNWKTPPSKTLQTEVQQLEKISLEEKLPIKKDSH